MTKLLERLFVRDSYFLRSVNYIYVGQDELNLTMESKLQSLCMEMILD